MCKERRWAIMDDNGIIEEGSLADIQKIWDDETEEYPDRKGDLLLIMIIERRR